MENVRIRVRESCAGCYWYVGIYDGKKHLAILVSGGSLYGTSYERKGNAIRAAEKLAKRLGIKYDPEIVKQHGC